MKKKIIGIMGIGFNQQAQDRAATIASQGSSRFDPTPLLAYLWLRNNVTPYSSCTL